MYLILISSDRVYLTIRSRQKAHWILISSREKDRATSPYRKEIPWNREKGSTFSNRERSVALKGTIVISDRTTKWKRKRRKVRSTQASPQERIEEKHRGRQFSAERGRQSGRTSRQLWTEPLAVFYNFLRSHNKVRQRVSHNSSQGLGASQFLVPRGAPCLPLSSRVVQRLTDANTRIPTPSPLY